MQQLALDGSWQARWFDGWRGGAPHVAERDDSDPRRWMAVTVPGEIHLDLMRSGLIADVDTGSGVLAARWVEECQWSFRRVLAIPEAVVAARSWLVFERLELVARIVLNGVEIGRHANAFLPCRIEVTGTLRPGRNLLVVHLESGLFEVGDKPSQGYLGFQDQRLHKRHWLRSPQCQFGWDWAPRLINVGITAPVRLEWSSATVRLAQVVPLVDVSDDLATGELRVRAFIDGLSQQRVAARVRLVLTPADGHPDPHAPSGASDPLLTREEAIAVEPGPQRQEWRCEIARPRLWWPAGHGEQPLYRLRVELHGAPGEMEVAECMIGFRRARIRQDDQGHGASGYAIEINHRRIFAKGGNLVPADLIRARITSDRYHQLIDRAREANFNLLRVWGGGLYEADAFYERCDRLGILVWQEFIFACGRYPGTDEAFVTSVKAEATAAIRRLAGHPCLVVWCGNNENEWGAWDWGFDKGVVLPDLSIAHFHLPRLLAEEDPDRYYQPSSPWSPSGHPNRDDAGDQHPWATTMADGEFRAFRTMTCRFPNEGGMLGPTALATVLECLPEGQRQFGSFAFRIHDNATESWHEPRGIDHAFREWTGRDPHQLSLERWVHLAGLLQGEGLREYCDNFRRRMFTSAAAIFWMYNDCWPATRSWSIVDHRLRRTPSFHAVRRALAPVSIVLAIEEGEVRIVGINDTRQVVHAQLTSGLFHLAGGRPHEHSQPVELAENAATLLGRFPQSLWQDPRQEVAFAELRDAQGLIARNRLILPRFAELAWSPASIQVSCADGIAVFTCAVFAWGVCLDLDGEISLPDNGFDLYPGVPYVLPWSAPEPPRILHIGNLLP